MNQPADTFALLTLTEGGVSSVVLTGTREQVKIATRWYGMPVALSGSADLLNAYRREASEDAKTIARLRLELEAERATVRALTAEMAEVRRTIEAMETLLPRVSARGEA